MLCVYSCCSIWIKYYGLHCWRHCSSHYAILRMASLLPLSIYPTSEDTRFLIACSICCRVGSAFSTRGRPSYFGWWFILHSAPDTCDFTLGQANIAGDFRGTGVLALKGMVFFCEHYERKASGPSDRETRAQPSTPTHIENNHASLDQTLFLNNLLLRLPFEKGYAGWACHSIGPIKETHARSCSRHFFL